MKRTRSFIPPDWQERFDRWVKERTVLELPISTSPRDARTPAVSFGQVHAILHAAWEPPIGEKRRMFLVRTHHGRVLFIPEDEKSLPQGEFDLSRSRFFSARLQRNQDGTFLFRQLSGQILLPLSQDMWKKAGADKLVGRIIELVGWPRLTCFIVMPRHGWEQVAMLSTLGTETQQKAAREKAIREEKQFGLIRVTLTSGVEIPVFANTILGIPVDEKFDKKSLGSHRRAAQKAIPATEDGTVRVAGVEISKKSFIQAIHDADELLKNLLARGITSTNQLIGEEFEPAVVEEHEAPAPEPAPAEPEIVECWHCASKVRFDPSKGTKREARCPKCEAPLFPGEADPNDMAAFPPEEHPLTAFILDGPLEALVAAGITTVGQLIKAKERDLKTITGLRSSEVRAIKKDARDYLAEAAK